MNDKQWEELSIEHEIAYLKADICLGSPESYRLEEKRAICEGMTESTAEVEAAMKKDFESLPPHGQAMMLDLLEKADPDNIAWWKSVLIGDMPDSPSAIGV